MTEDIKSALGVNRWAGSLALERVRRYYGRHEVKNEGVITS